MSGNLFFDEASLAHRGKNVIIGKTVRIRYPELVRLGDNVIIDDFTYISTALECDDYVHISAGAKLIGGRQATVRFGQFSTLAPNVVLAAGSDDTVKPAASLPLSCWLFHRPPVASMNDLKLPETPPR